MTARALGPTSAACYPVLRRRLPQTAFADGGAAGEITVDRFLADAAALAARLPDSPYVVNLCADRYRFAVGFVAALHRRQITLLPSSEAAAPLTQLTEAYPGLYFLHDETILIEHGVEAFRFPPDLVGDAPAVMPEFPSEQQAAILFTSGSTGTPMPNPRSWGALVNSTRAAAEELGLPAQRGGHILGTVPHQHSFGLESIMMLAFQGDLTIHDGRPLLPADVLARLERLPEPRILVTTPIHLRGLVAHGGALPRVDRIICATAPLAPALAQEAETRFGGQLFEIYGCSEVGQIGVRRTVETLEWSCIDGITLAERDGDVWASGPAAAAMAPLNDVIELHGSKRFVLHGRKSDMVNIAGKRSSLGYLNHHLNRIEGVRDGIFVVPDDGDGVARLSAYVVAPGLSADAIIAALRQNLDSAFLPRRIQFVDTLPRNALGKLTRDALDQLAVTPPEQDGIWRSVDVAFEPDHATAEGHFPSNPIIPGALLLDHVLRAVAGTPSSADVRAVKFLRPVRPGERITIRWRRDAHRDLAFEVWVVDHDGPALVGALTAHTA